MPNPTSTSTNPSNEQTDPFAALPTETEIYILPGGAVVIADLPTELAQRLLPEQDEPQTSLSASSASDTPTASDIPAVNNIPATDAPNANPHWTNPDWANPD